MLNVVANLATPSDGTWLPPQSYESGTVFPLRFKEKSISAGGELTQLDIGRVTCGSKLVGWRDFFPFFSPFLFNIICPKSLALKFV